MVMVDDAARLSAKLRKLALRPMRLSQRLRQVEQEKEKFKIRQNNSQVISSTKKQEDRCLDEAAAAKLWSRVVELSRESDDEEELLEEELLEDEVLEDEVLEDEVLEDGVPEEEPLVEQLSGEKTSAGGNRIGQFNRRGAYSQAPITDVAHQIADKSEKGNHRSRPIEASEVHRGNQEDDNLRSKDGTHPQDYPDRAKAGSDKAFALPLNHLSMIYAKGRQISSGAYGCVYLLRHRQTKALAAAKYQVAADPEEAEAARHEAALLRRLSHRHIVAFRHFFCSKRCTSSILVTEYLECGELFDVISRPGYSLRESKCQIIFRQVLKAVDYLHDRLIVHLDLKPENILLTRTSKSTKG